MGFPLPLLTGNCSDILSTLTVGSMRSLLLQQICEISFERADASGYRPLLAGLYIVDLSASRSNSQRPFYAFASRLEKMVKDQLLDCACVLKFDPHNGIPS